MIIESIADLGTLRRSADEEARIEQMIPASGIIVKVNLNLDKSCVNDTFWLSMGDISCESGGV